MLVIKDIEQALWYRKQKILGLRGVDFRILSFILFLNILHLQYCLWIGVVRWKLEWDSQQT